MTDQPSTQTGALLTLFVRGALALHPDLDPDGEVRDELRDMEELVAAAEDAALHFKMNIGDHIAEGTVKLDTPRATRLMKAVTKVRNQR
jgi:hypothetical protein